MFNVYCEMFNEDHFRLGVGYGDAQLISQSADQLIDIKGPIFEARFTWG
jgi:hypothetical protein